MYVVTRVRGLCEVSWETATVSTTLASFVCARTMALRILARVDGFSAACMALTKLSATVYGSVAAVGTVACLAALPWKPYALVSVGGGGVGGRVWSWWEKWLRLTRPLLAECLVYSVMFLGTFLPARMPFMWRVGLGPRRESSIFLERVDMGAVTHTCKQRGCEV